MGLYITSRALKLAKIAFLGLLLLFVLGVQRGCQLVEQALGTPPAVCMVPAPLLLAPTVFRLMPLPSLDRKRLAPSDTSRPGARAVWRGFRGPAYHAGAWPRPVKVPRDSAGHVITSRPSK
jgi:hypothetical protein